MKLIKIEKINGWKPLKIHKKTYGKYSVKVTFINTTTKTGIKT